MHSKTTICVFLIGAFLFVGCIQQGTTQPLTPITPNLKVEFCESVKSKTAQLLAQKTPDENIATSEYKDNLLLWKELFLKENRISEGYLNQHIRLWRVSMNLHPP